MQATAQFFDYDELPDFITRREQKQLKRLERKGRQNNQVHQSTKQPNYSIRNIKPSTENQSRVFESFHSGQNLLLHGTAGTGKTFLALYLALTEVISGKIEKPVVILRSVVPSRDIGYLPGRIDEKAAIYEEPYRGLCSELTYHPTAYDYFKKQELIQFSTTSFLRGLTFRDNIIIVDEAQNCSGQELNTIMTRVGEGCRMIVCADFTQSDLNQRDDRLGFTHFMKIVTKMPSFTHIEFTVNDIQRSSFVKEYLLAKADMGIDF